MDRETVVLVHGIARTGRSLAPLARHLRQAGFDAVTIDYPSRRLSIRDAAHHVATQLPAAGRLHFVTHSMGGLVVAEMIEAGLVPTVGRVVMLAPPNHGSAVADLLKAFPPYRWLFGPAGQELGTATRHPGRATFPLGIIAGRRGWAYPLGMLALQRPHDGRVSVASTYRDGMTDHMVVESGHSLIMNHPEVRRLVVGFLRDGRFSQG